MTGSKREDFLPFTCDGCSKIYCSDHRTKDSHGCSKEHISTAGCEYTGVRGYTCSLEECSKRELTRIVCERCQQTFCLSHRHAQDHRCSKLEIKNETKSRSEKTAQHVTEILASKQSVAHPKKPRGTKSSKTAAKVALMKMKMNAKGDQGCPDVDRVYLRVCLPLQCNRESAQLFFSKTWSVGRTIDSIAERLGLVNKNNVLTAQKLHLFSLDTCSILQTDSDLDSLLKEELLFSGSSVILEYVDNDCEVIQDVSRYKLS